MSVWETAVVDNIKADDKIVTIFLILLGESQFKESILFMIKQVSGFESLIDTISINIRKFLKTKKIHFFSLR